jgi:N-sulfoglucosamine sulfohydrolase
MKETLIINHFALLPLIGVALLSCQKEEKRPNILIAMADDVSFPHMSAYGCKFVKTPGFDRVARKGILFNNAYTPNAKCTPSRSSILTGRNSWQLEAGANHWSIFPPRFTTFMESLNTRGYNVGYTAKGWGPGIALDSTGKPRNMTGKAFNARKTTPPTTGISPIDYAANFEDFLNSGDQGKPFCFWYGSLEPHRAYEFGTGVKKGEKRLSDIVNLPKFLPDTDLVRNDILDYAFEIEYFDSHLVRMIDILEKSGKLDNTIVIVTADNGMSFPNAKGQCYEYSNHMPMAIMWGKGIKNPGRTVDDFISFIDIAPTLLETAGIKESESGMQPIEGRSFTDIFHSGKKGMVDNTRDHVLIGKERHDMGRPDDVGYPIRGIIKGGFLYLKNFKTDRWPGGNPETGYLQMESSPTKSVILNMRRSGLSQEFWNLTCRKRMDEELYNITTDSDCIKNLAGDPGFNSVKQKLWEQLENELREQEDPRILGNGDIFDKYPFSDEGSRDLYNRYMKEKPDEIQIHNLKKWGVYGFNGFLNPENIDTDIPDSLK